MQQSKTIIITGSSSGIGLSLCKHYLTDGYSVIGLARRTNSLLSEFSNYTHVTIDLNDLEAIKNWIHSVKSYIKNIKLVVLNAGILGEIKRMEETSILEAKSVFEVNLWANKNMIDELILQKINCQQIVAISSGASKNGNAGWGAYSISKAALNILIQTYAAENPEIHFSAVAPGLVDTAMQDYIYELKSEKEFPSLQFLQAAKGTENMPTPSALAPKLAALFTKIKLEEQSGIYTDIRIN